MHAADSPQVFVAGTLLIVSSRSFSFSLFSRSICVRPSLVICCVLSISEGPSMDRLWCASLRSPLKYLISVVRGPNAPQLQGLPLFLEAGREEGFDKVSVEGLGGPAIARAPASGQKG